MQKKCVPAKSHKKNQLKETNTNREENGMENIMKMLVTVNKSMIKMQQTLDEVENKNICNSCVTNKTKK
jgi:hypothetical protein